MPMIDDALIHSCQRGDSSAFERLLAILYDVIYRFALRWAGTVADAEDITQQACIKLARVIGQFRFESAFTTWLYTLVLNCANDWSRKERRHRHSSGSDSDASLESGQETYGGAHGSDTTYQATEADRELQRVLAQVDRMGKGFKETVILVYGEGQSHQEAAAVMGIKESTVSWRLHEIRQQLKAQTEREGISNER